MPACVSVDNSITLVKKTFVFLLFVLFGTQIGAQTNSDTISWLKSTLTERFESEHWILGGVSVDSCNITFICKPISLVQRDLYSFKMPVKDLQIHLIFTYFYLNDFLIEKKKIPGTKKKHKKNVQSDPVFIASTEASFRINISGQEGLTQKIQNTLYLLANNCP